jgi:hypothetical protein
VTVADDRASDRRVAVSAAFLVVAEAVVAGLADSGVIAIWLWAVLAVVAVGVTAVLAAWLGRAAQA